MAGRQQAQLQDRTKKLVLDSFPQATDSVTNTLRVICRSAVDAQRREIGPCLIHGMSRRNRDDRVATQAFICDDATSACGTFIASLRQDNLRQDKYRCAWLQFLASTLAASLDQFLSACEYKEQFYRFRRFQKPDRASCKQLEPPRELASVAGQRSVFGWAPCILVSCKYQIRYQHEYRR